jgi:hypothetical protein
MRQVSQNDRYTRSRAITGAQETKVTTNQLAKTEEEFAIGNIKDLVNSKLKEMRTL